MAEKASSQEDTLRMGRACTDSKTFAIGAQML